MNIDWEKLKNPHELFTVFKIDDKDPIEFYKKRAELERMFLKKKLWIEQEYRNKDAINAMLNIWMCNGSSVFYEVGDFQGFVGFVNILPEYKCGAMFKIWDKKIFGKTLVRALRELTELYLTQFKLKRISTGTGDKDMVQLAEMCGFKVEGEAKYAFKWGNEYYSKFSLVKLED